MHVLGAILAVGQPTSVGSGRRRSIFEFDVSWFQVASVIKSSKANRMVMVCTGGGVA